VRDRRAFMRTVAGGLLIAPLAILAQQVARVSRIGYLRRTSREPADIEALRRGLRELGYVDGQNLVIDERYANGVAARLPDLARELMQLKVQVVVVDGGATVRAVREVVGATPLVFAFTGDPVGAGFVRSLDHPGGTMTGLTNFSGELLLKRLQLLHEVVPAKRVGFLFNAASFKPTRTADHLIQAGRSLGIDLTLVDAPTPGDLPGAFAKMSQAGVAAALVDADAMFFSQRARIVELAAKYQLPAVYAEREFADAGGLMAYSPNVSMNFYRAASYVDKILKGARAGDLAIEQPTKLELVINLKAASALGLALPQSLLRRADDVIQ
jgi:putative ABC transport system substrate-binding protein